MSATTCAGVSDWYRSWRTYRFRCERSTQRRILSVFFLGVTTIGADHSVGWVTGVMMPCACRCSSLALSLTQYAKGTERGVLMQNGLASEVSVM